MAGHLFVEPCTNINRDSIQACFDQGKLITVCNYVLTYRLGQAHIDGTRTLLIPLGYLGYGSKLGQIRSSLHLYIVFVFGYTQL